LWLTLQKKSEEVAKGEIEEETRLNAEYADFLEFQAKMVGRLKREEPTVSTSSLNLAEDFSALLEAAKEKDRELRESGELSDDPSTSSLGSDYDFLNLPRKHGDDAPPDENQEQDPDDYDDFDY
jgi:hypothetical protein